MQTLNLKKQCVGYYANTFQDITITVCNASALVKEGSKYWQLIIEDNKNVMFQSFFNTKKQCMEYGAKWAIKNF
jgi:hypothetical protein